MVSLAPLAISVQSVRPTYPYGQLAAMPVSTTAAMFTRVGLPAAIAEDAVIATATLVLTQREAVSGSTTVNLRRAAAGFTVARTTWNNQPALTGSTVGVTKSSPAAGTLWSFDVTADVQAFAAGTASNFGWRLIATVAAAAGLRFRGPTAQTGQPLLVIDYLEPGEAPEDLSPNGAVVSIAKPTLSFLVAPDTTAVKVQVDSDTIGTADFDSGEIASTAGQVDLATTAYAGLANGATTYWRAQSRGGTGLTAWSAWASFTRTAKATVSITSPATTSDDGSPPILWSVSGGTQESWRVIVRDSVGALVADSGRIGGTATTWVPTKPILKTEGRSVTIEVRVWDSVDRAITPGDPDYSTASRTVVLSTSGGVTNPATVSAVNDGISPSVEITATAASAPDGWAIIRDGERIYYDATQPVSTFTFVDWTATPNHQHIYRAARIVNNAVSAGGPTAVITPRVTGLWLVDATLGQAAVLYGLDEGSWSAAELAIIHQPIAGPPIRRVAYRPPLSGSISGELVDTNAQDADDSISNLYDFKSSSADRELRFIAGDRNIPVNVGDITVSPAPLSGEDRWSRASFSWMQIDEVPWVG